MLLDLYNIIVTYRETSLDRFICHIMFFRISSLDILQLGSRHNKWDIILVQWESMKMLMLILKDVTVLQFVKKHCLHTRSVLAMMMGHNKQCKMHSGDRWEISVTDCVSGCNHWYVQHPVYKLFLNKQIYKKKT